MTTYEFQQYVKSKNLSGEVRDKAWKIYHNEGVDAATNFIIDATTNVRKPVTLRDQPVPYQTWGSELINDNAFEQMAYAAQLPVTMAAALMPDAHLGYGLPIGGVLAVDNVVIPYAVGVDIACRMMLSIFYIDADILDDKKSFDKLSQNLVDTTIFGAGASGLNDGTFDHPVLHDQRWNSTPLLKSLHQTAVRQLGTSGGGNHFADIGVYETKARTGQYPHSGRYLALLTHSGSRGVGAKIANHYSSLASSLLPEIDNLAWLSLDSEAGQEYWNAMELAGDFASANHHIIHERFSAAFKVVPIHQIENHHNFAWRENIMVNGEMREAIVHRKGATPAGLGVMGIIPGTMADFGYIVRGRGNAESLNSASHGGGRQMSRNQAKKTVTKEEQKLYLKKKGVTLIGGGLDEAPQAYKSIESVMAAQDDLIEIVGRFQPRLVRMADDSIKPWDVKSVPDGIVDIEGD